MKKGVEKEEEYYIKIFTNLMIIFLIILFILGIILGNYEFVYYNIVIIPIFIISYFIHKKINLHLPLFILVCLLIVLHFLGGLIVINGVRLYDINFILQYDNIIHFIEIFIVVFISYGVIYKYIRPYSKDYNAYIFIILVLMGLGVGALIEIVELFGVVFLNAGPRVGDYMNNALDLAWDFVGSIIASFLIRYFHKSKYFKRLVFNK